MVSLVVALVVGQGDSLVMDRFALSERVKRVEVAWENAPPATRKKAVSNLTTATMSFFAGGGDRAAQSLDRAVATLEGRALRPADAITVRALRPFYEPLAPLTLKLDWAYRPASVLPVPIKVAGKATQITPGTPLTITIDPASANPDLRQNPEVGYLVPVTIGNDPRLAYVSFVRHYAQRLGSMAKSGDPFVSYVGSRLEAYQKNPETLETDLPLIQALFGAEAINEGRRTIADQDQIYLNRHADTVFRAVFPRSLRGRTGGKATVVIALHGAGGSENMFFEAYGRGAAVEEALSRGWVFVGARTGENAINDVLAWLRSVRKLNVGQLFLIGHSMGAGLVLNAESAVAPAAAAAFAPPGGRPNPKVPTFLAVGKQEIPMIRSACAEMANSESNRADFVFKEYDPAEHMMVVGEGMGDAYRFFDRYASR